jgi:hypothetical protein
MIIREAYKMYWKLKTKALEESLTEITFCKDVENSLPTDTYAKSKKCLEHQENRSKIILNQSESLLLKKKSLYTLPINTANKNDSVNKANLKGTCQQLNLNKNCMKNDKTIFERSSSFQLSQNMCKSLHFSKRNPRKSLSISKLDEFQIKSEEITNKRINSSEVMACKIPDLFKCTFNNDIKIFLDDKRLPENSTIQNLIETSKTTYNTKLNPGWLNRCIANNSLESSISKTNSMYYNDNKSEHLDYNNLHDKNILTPNVLGNHLVTDEEDYICNSDTEEDRKKKRIRNFKKIFYDSNLEPAKKLCKSNNSEKNESDNNCFKRSIIDINGIRFSNDCSSTINCNNSIYTVRINELQKINNSSKNETIKFKSPLQNINQTIINNASSSIYSRKILHNCLNKQCLNKIESKNEDLIEDNLKNTINQMPIKDTESFHERPHSSIDTIIPQAFSCCCNPLNFQTNTLPIKFRPNNKKRSEQKIFREKLNENFLKLNLKKKIFVNGKKIFNLSKYKKNQWKKKKEPRSLDETNLKLSEFTNTKNRFLCLKYGELRPSVRHCKNIQDYSSLFDANIDFQRNLTLDEVEELTKINTVGTCHQSIIDLKGNNVSSIKLNTPVHSSNCKNVQGKTVLENASINLYLKILI